MNWLSGIYAKLAGLLAFVGTGLYIFFLKSDRDNLEEEVEDKQHEIKLLRNKALIEDDLRDRARDRSTSMKKAHKENAELLESIKHENDNRAVVVNIKRLLKHKDKN